MSYMKRLATQIMLEFSDNDCRLVEFFDEPAPPRLTPDQIERDHLRRIAREIAEAAGRDEPNATDEQDALDLMEQGYSIDNLPAAFWNDRRQRMVWCS